MKTCCFTGGLVDWACFFFFRPKNKSTKLNEFIKLANLKKENNQSPFFEVYIKLGAGFN